MSPFGLQSESESGSGNVNKPLGLTVSKDSRSYSEHHCAKSTQILANYTENNLNSHDYTTSERLQLDSAHAIPFSNWHKGKFTWLWVVFSLWCLIVNKYFFSIQQFVKVNTKLAPF